jgi:hypothetical protein
MKINCFLIDDYKQELGPDPTFDMVMPHEEPRQRIFQFTSLLHNPQSGKLYCGVTNFDSNILHEFDPKTKKFKSLDYKNRFSARNYYDVKIHRSLELDEKTNSCIGISSGLHSAKYYNDGPGAHLFRYDCNNDTYEDLGMPMPHEYTQTITYDPKRQLVYGFTLHYFAFYAYDIRKKQTIFHSRPDSITHVSAIDDSGCIWSTWDRNKHYLFKYDPAQNKCVYFDHGFPEESRNLMYPGAGPIDRMLNIGDGFLYVALENGSLYRIHPDTAKVEFLGRGAPLHRLPGLCQGIDPDTLYCVTGDLHTTLLIEYHLKKRTFTTLCQVRNKQRSCYRPHDIAVIGNTIYIAETDNPWGACGLWEVEL